MNPSSPTFSVILPVYNRAGSVGRALGSVLEQSHPPDEVIVVDDGSSDDLAAALAPFGDRIVLIRQANAGAAAARNAGAARARGDWLTFQDSDDIWAPDHLEIRHRDLRDAAADVVGHLGDVVFRGDGYAQNLFAMQGHAFPGDRAMRVDAPLGLVIGGMSLLGTAIRRDVFDRLGGFDEEMWMFEDTAFCCRLAQEGPFVVTGHVMAEAERLEGDTQALTVVQQAKRVYYRQMALRVLERIDMTRANPAEQTLIRRRMSGARLALALALEAEDRAGARALIWQSAREHPEPLKGWIKAIMARLFGARGVQALNRAPAALDRS